MFNRWRNQGGQGGDGPPDFIGDAVGPSDYVPFNKCKDFSAVNEHRKTTFVHFNYCCS